ncbi:MAG: DUF1684 domain-containing protein, partial [Bdellovibrionales bacterium]|nr:DUF1684 domain-containing protein [Bdellovibrionales bacterium]NQZ17914.1 DUF1684 domain-containing protein [Bdellovibrionales bacterium]
ARFVEERTEVAYMASNGEIWDDVRYGWVVFEKNGVEYKIAVYEYDEFDSTDEDAEVQLRYTDSPDSESYTGGRYAYAKIKDLKNPEGFYLDLNRSHDPPCAYSQAYSCSLPGPDERIDIIVEGGRKWAERNVY